MSVFYISDLHIGHTLVAGKRGFIANDQSADESLGVALHDAWLANQWDSVVNPDDTVFVLGDISINGKQHALDWIGQRRGTKHLISGNHDPVHPQYRDKALKLLPHWHQYFTTIQPYVRRKLRGETVWLSHFPYISWGDGPERGEPRWRQHRLPDFGDLLLHGHTHGKERDHDNMFHVGVDAWHGVPVPQDVILDWVESRQNAGLILPNIVRY